MSGQASYTRTSSPHIHSGDSVVKRNWFRAAALFPVIVVALWFGGLEFLRNLVLGTVSVIGLEWLSAGIFRKKTALADGDAVLAGLLFSLLLPERYPIAGIELGAFLMVFIVNGCFGGAGSRPFNAAAFAIGFLHLVFPGAMTEPIAFRLIGGLWMDGAVALCAVFFLIQKRNYFEAWFYAVIIFLAGKILLAGGTEWASLIGAGIFSAIFILGDPATLPLTRRGTNLFAIGAALFAVLLDLYATTAVAVCCGILVMGCLVPWLDAWYNPAGLLLRRRVGV